MTEIITSLSVEGLRDQLQRFGYRAEIVVDDAAKVTLLRSATSGMNFDIRLGNALASDPSRHVDFTFLGLFKVEGELPLAPVNEWNNARRFCRLHLNQGFLLLDMDVSVVSGITADHLRAHLEIWDQLLQGLIVFLRAELPRLAESQAALSPDMPATAQATH